MSKIVSNLNEIQSIVATAIDEIHKGKSTRDALMYLASGLDKRMSKIVTELGGDPWQFKKTNETSLQLALGEVD